MSRSAANLLMRLLGVYLRFPIDDLKIRAVTYYVKSVAAGRKVFINYIGLKCLLLLMMFGFVLMHVGLFMCLPCSAESKGIVLLILGGIYFLVSLIFILKYCSERYWMKKTKASDFVRRVTDN